MDTLDLTPTSYFGLAFRPDLLVENATFDLAEMDYDTIIGTGLSGTMVAPFLGYFLNKNWAIIRKNENHHSYLNVEGKIGKRWLFVDDLIATGATFIRCRTQVESQARRSRFETRCVGTYEYEHRRLRFN